MVTTLTNVKNQLFLFSVLVFLSMGTAFPQCTHLVKDDDASEIRLQVSEGQNLSGGVRAAVTEYFHDNDDLPLTNSDAGVADSFNIKGKYVVAVAVSKGVIVVEYGRDADSRIFGRTIEYMPTISGDKITWSCSSEYIDDQYLPETCQ